MKLFISICLFILLFLNVQQGYSQKEVGFSGNTYLLHKVKKSETIYGLCQKYKVTQEELKTANFGLTSVLNVGDILKIPVKKVVATQKLDQQSVNVVATEPEYYYHKVIKRQTIFSISRQYGITANELIRYNPEI
ncbi:MAG: LysM peptidoglycan-binding domain-containing protein, partial [Bacteroidota bacterium]|nr:LysM peptidoglycan-binding domain-containing protein [Bacteroidota bacterium]